MHPNSATYLNKSTQQLFEMHEKEKKRSYLEQVLQVEKGSFTPIVFSTFGTSGKEAQRYHKRIAELLADKKNERYEQVLSHMKTRLCFSLRRSILMAVREVRGRQQSPKTVATVEFSTECEVLNFILYLCYISVD